MRAGAFQSLLAISACLHTNCRVTSHGISGRARYHWPWPKNSTPRFSCSAIPVWSATAIADQTVPGFIPVVSEETRIPGNEGLTAADRAARKAEVFDPFHDHVAGFLDQRRSEGRRTLLVTIHSFTPVFKGESRPWEIGVLYNRDRSLSPAMLEYLRKNTEHSVGDNQPYAVGDDSDYAVPIHGEGRNLPSVEIEIRNDLTQGAEAVSYWSDLLTAALTDSDARITQ